MVYACDSEELLTTMSQEPVILNVYDMVSSHCLDWKIGVGYGNLYLAAVIKNLWIIVLNPRVHHQTFLHKIYNNYTSKVKEKIYETCTAWNEFANLD